MECKDTNWRCTFWSLEIFQYCEKYAIIREKICPQSCGACEQKNEPNLIIKTGKW